MVACIECKQDLEQGAKVCDKCGNFQRGWKNSLRYFAGISAAITLSATAMSLLYTFFEGIYDRLTWKYDIATASFSTHGGALFKNNGSGDIFLETIKFLTPDLFVDGSGIYEAFTVNESLRKGESIYCNIGTRASISPLDFNEREVFSETIREIIHGADPDERTVAYFAGAAAEGAVFQELESFDCTIRFRLHPNDLDSVVHVVDDSRCFGVVAKINSPQQIGSGVDRVQIRCND